MEDAQYTEPQSTSRRERSRRDIVENRRVSETSEIRRESSARTANRKVAPQQRAVENEEDFDEYNYVDNPKGHIEKEDPWED